MERVIRQTKPQVVNGTDFTEDVSGRGIKAGGHEARYKIPACSAGCGIDYTKDVPCRNPTDTDHDIQNCRETSAFTSPEIRSRMTGHNRQSDPENKNSGISTTIESGVWSRRRILKAGIAGGFTACMATGAWSFIGAPHHVEIVRVPMPVRDLPERLAGKTIVQISDLHVGPVVSSDYIRHCLELVSSLQPDVVAITGDFVTYDGPDRIDEVVSLLRDMQPGKLATVAVTGNHDFGGARNGFSNRRAADSLTEQLDDIGIRMLRNESVNIDGLRLLGVDDFWGPTHDLGMALSSGDTSHPSVMLCHNPDFVDQSGWDSFRGWILSGHTHGGQVRLPFCKPPILPIRNHDYIAGKVELPGNRTLYVNRGLGYLRKVRLNVRPEITVFELSSDS